jgi:acetolactate decarboxylase
VRARSIPRQQPPYRPLAEVAADQHVFELREVSGTLVGFRFPDYASGLEVAGYHLHFITDDRRRGGHVLDYTARAGRLRIDTSSELHVELPPGVELGGAHVDEEELARIERAG